MRKRFIELLENTTAIGTGGLINHLEANGFFEAPASTRYHMSHRSGLLEHSLNVHDIAKGIWESSPVYQTAIKAEDLTLAALLHDIGKTGWNGKEQYIPNILKSGKVSDAQPYETNPELIKMQHQDLSLLIALKFIELSDEVLVAIKYHNGLYTPDGRDISGKETPLMLLIHFADMWASRITEDK